MYSPDQTKSLQKVTTGLTEKNSQGHITEKDIETLRDVLRFHEHRYYILNDPLIADFEYDQLYKALEKIEKEHPSLVTPDPSG
jgi:DNA ligase (NAD+)